MQITRAMGLTSKRSAHWLAEVNVVVRQSNAARQFAASSWLDGRSNGKAISEAKASFPCTALAGANGSCKFCIAEVRPGPRWRERAWFVYGSDAPSAVHRPLGNLLLARSGR